MPVPVVARHLTAIRGDRALQAMTEADDWPCRAARLCGTDDASLESCLWNLASADLTPGAKPPRVMTARKVQKGTAIARALTTPPTSATQASSICIYFECLGRPTDETRTTTRLMCWVTGFQLAAFDFRLPTSNFQLPTSNFHLSTSTSQLPTSNFHLSASHAHAFTPYFSLVYSDNPTAVALQHCGDSAEVTSAASNGFPMFPTSLPVGHHGPMLVDLAYAIPPRFQNHQSPNYEVADRKKLQENPDPDAHGWRNGGSANEALLSVTNEEKLWIGDRCLPAEAHEMSQLGSHGSAGSACSKVGVVWSRPVAAKWQTTWKEKCHELHLYSACAVGRRSCSQAKGIDIGLQACVGGKKARAVALPPQRFWEAHLVLL
ncbi:hypothetical protein BJ875DRAFT_436598 [Amylocarpus encephaloides]|uniref:Uncharacterized protein n=1 Tax=Amylocarpus encephaloides TaxID=45428 RepID=A0A9P7YTC3_9HELO|nr:hypothetical protein BJ875DRAFT_436598 [Amylocarpus encephaloides]